MLSGNVCFSLIFIPLFCMKKYFIGSKSQIVPGAVVYLSALGNTLVCPQQLELQREREGRVTEEKRLNPLVSPESGVKKCTS